MGVWLASMDEVTTLSAKSSTQKNKKRKEKGTKGFFSSLTIWEERSR
jgi:hypothetical protein